MTLESTPPPGQSAPDELQKRIQELVDGLYTQDEEGVFRKLCRLACGWKLDPDQFRLMLMQAGLRPSRASELKTVLVGYETCLQFIRGSLSWKKALAQARNQVEDPLALAAANLIKLLFEKGHLWPEQDVEGGWSLERDRRHQFRFTHQDSRIVEVLRGSFIRGGQSAPSL